MLAASLTLNQFVTCQALPGSTRLDISLSIPQHIPAPPDYTILARIDELLAAGCSVLTASTLHFMTSQLFSPIVGLLTTIVVTPLYFLSNLNNSFIKKSRLSKMDGKLVKTKAEPRSGY